MRSPHGNRRTVLSTPNTALRLTIVYSFYHYLFIYSTIISCLAKSSRLAKCKFIIIQMLNRTLLPSSDPYFSTRFCKQCFPKLSIRKWANSRIVDVRNGVSDRGASDSATEKVFSRIFHASSTLFSDSFPGLVAQLSETRK